MVKVVHLTTVHPPFDTRIFHKECITLSKAGFNITLITQNDNSDVIQGINIISIPKVKSRFHRIFLLSWQTYKKAKEVNADLYHFHDPELLLIGFLLKKFTKKKVIYDVHEDVYEQILTKYWIPMWLRRIISKTFNIIEKNIAKSFDAIVVATEGIAEKFKNLHHLVIHNYADISMLPDKKQIKCWEKIDKLIYAGAISKIRGIFEMVHALEYLDPSCGIQLMLIGKFESNSLESEIRLLPGYNSVIFLGWLDNKEVYTQLQNAHIGLVCLYPEPRYLVSLPVKLFEYMAAGIPVIASNFPHWKEIIEGNNCGITVDPLNPREIAAAIEFIISHPEEARKMGENGCRAVIEKYNWENEGKKLIRLYEELLNS